VRQSPISIAMAAYNSERFIREQLQSFLKQSRLPDELIVSDDASTDHTVEIVREFAAHAPFPVRLFVNQRNLGVVTNFESAIRRCNGDIIFLSDCDDVWYPDKLESMERAFANWPEAGLVVCDADLVDEQLRPLGRTLWEKHGYKYSDRAQRLIATGRRFRMSVPGQGCCLAFKAAFTNLVLPLPDRNSPPVWHDIFIVWTIVFSGAGRLVPIARPLVAYRQHAQQLAGASGTELTARLARRRSRPPLGPFLERIEGPTAAEYSKDRPLRQAVLRHWRARWHLPASHIGRLPVVFRELLSGRYHRFSHGFSAAVKDLLFVK
jgi:glycosyltransferase involved in cell wall biosynthesis